MSDLPSVHRVGELVMRMQTVLAGYTWPEIYAALAHLAVNVRTRVSKLEARSIDAWAADAAVLAMERAAKQGAT